MADIKMKQVCSNPVELTAEQQNQLENADTANVKNQEADTGYLRKDGIYQPEESATPEEKAAFETFKAKYKDITGKDISEACGPKDEPKPDTNNKSEKPNWSLGLEAGFGVHYSPSDTLTDKPATMFRHDYSLFATVGGEQNRFKGLLGVTVRSLGGVSLDGACNFKAGATDPWGNAFAGDNVNNCERGSADFGSVGPVLGLGYGLHLDNWELDVLAKYAHLINNDGYSHFGSYDGPQPSPVTNEFGLSVGAAYLLTTQSAGNFRFGVRVEGGADVNDVGPISGIPDRDASQRTEVNGYFAGMATIGWEFPSTGKKDTTEINNPTPPDEKCEESPNAVKVANDWLVSHKADLEKIGVPKEIELSAYYIKVEDAPGKKGSGSDQNYRVVIAGKTPDGNKFLLVNNETGQFATTADFDKDIAKENSSKAKSESVQKVITLNEQLLQFSTAHPASPIEDDLIRQVADTPNITADQFQSIMVAKQNPQKGRPIVSNKQQVQNTIDFAESLNTLIKETKEDKNVKKISVIVEGHASRTGNETKNQMYSANRAATEAALLKSHGITDIESVGYGSTTPDDTLGNAKSTAQQRVIVKIKVEYADGTVSIDTAKDFAIKTQKKSAEHPDVDMNTKYSAMTFDDNGDGTYTEVFYRRDGNDGELGNVYRSSQDIVSLDKCAGKDFVTKGAKPSASSIDENIQKAQGFVDEIAKLPTSKPADKMTKDNQSEYDIPSKSWVALKRLRSALFSIKENANEVQKAKIKVLLDSIKGHLAPESAISGYVSEIVKRRAELATTSKVTEKPTGRTRRRERNPRPDPTRPEPATPTPKTKKAAPGGLGL